MFLNKKLLLVILLTFSSAILVSAEEKLLVKSYAEAKELYKKGHLAFASLQYDEAIRYYGAVETFLDSNPRFKEFFDHNFRSFSMIEIVKKHRQLGAITPGVTHKIAVFYIDQVNAPFKGSRIKSTFTQELKDTAYLSQEICKRYIEVLSGGEVTVEFTRMDLKAELTELTSYIQTEDKSNPIEIVQGEIESLVPYPSLLLFEKTGKFDTFLFYWNDNKLETPGKGGAKALGGTFLVPFLPYQLYGPERGRIIISAALLDRPGTLLHEIFHTLERCYAITPVHGFYEKNRTHFSGWNGQGEFSYYQYHFDRIKKEDNFKAFDLLSRAKNPIPLAVLENNIRHYSGIAKEKLQKAQEIFEQAARIHHKNKNKAFQLYKKVITLNPYHSQALLRIGTHYHSMGDIEKAFNFVESAYKIKPADSEICYWMGVESYHKARYEEAIGYFTESLTYNPLSAKAFQYRGFVHYKQAHYAEALKDFKSSLKISSQFEKWIMNYLEGREKAGDQQAGRMLKQLNTK